MQLKLQIAKTVQCFRFEPVEKTSCRFLAWPVAISEMEKCRYVFTGTLQRLRWPLTAMFPSGPLL